MLQLQGIKHSIIYINIVQLKELLQLYNTLLARNPWQSHDRMIPEMNAHDAV